LVSKEKLLKLSEKSSMAEVKRIKYSYRDAKQSAAIKHTFHYLSAVSGIAFEEDANSPDLFLGPAAEIPQSVKVIITGDNSGSKRTQIRDTDSGNWINSLDYNPVESLMAKLSFKAKSGPYSHKLAAPSGIGERTLSGLVNDIINILYRVGLIENESRPNVFWPKTLRFGMAITHDVDIPRRSILGGIRLLINQQLPGRIAALIDSFKASFGLMPNPYDTTAEWIKFENELGIKSTFFVFDGNRRHGNDPKYNPSSLSKSFGKLLQNDLEIALHTGINCYSGNGIDEAKSTLEQVSQTKLRGVRPHYLSAFYPEYWQAASSAGFAYSSALGFDRDIGFWDGIDLPFYPFDQTNDKLIPILEIPIAIMDCGLIGDLPADSDKTLERAMRLIDQSAATGGLIVLDWHERTLYNRDYPGWGELFLKIVRYGKGKGAHLFRLDEMAAEFSKRFQG
jgi:hypothetical protein